MSVDTTAVTKEDFKESPGTTDPNINTNANTNKDNDNQNNNPNADNTDDSKTQVDTSQQRILPGTKIDDDIPTRPEHTPAEKRLLEFDVLDHKIKTLLLTKFESELNTFKHWPSFIVSCFVIAYRHNYDEADRIKETVTKFENFLQFYKSTSFDISLQSESVMSKYRPFEEDALKGLPFFLYGMDKEGHPVYWQKDTCFFKLFEAFKNDDNNDLDFNKLKLYNSILWRRFYNLKMKYGAYYNTTIFYHTAVIDCADLKIFESIDQFRRHYHFFLNFFGFTTDYFPESVYRIVMINAPFAFKMTMKIAETIIVGETTRKILVYGSDYINHLTEIIDINMIPKEYGGNGKWEVRMGDMPKDFALSADDEYLPFVKDVINDNNDSNDNDSNNDDSNDSNGNQDNKEDNQNGKNSNQSENENDSNGNGNNGVTDSGNDKIDEKKETNEQK